MDNQKLVVVMVGLPARGKTHVARKLSRYLSWLGYRTRLFNVGSYRRARLGPGQSAEFFDPTNESANEARHAVSAEALEDLIKFVEREGRVGIFDATNTTREKRAWVEQRCRAAGFDVLFVELVCDDPIVIEVNVRATKTLSQDYEGMDPEQATRDFRARIENYERVYEPLDESDGRFVKVMDLGQTVVAHRIHGYLESRIVAFLLASRPTRRVVWLSRHGESRFNAQGRIGGDSELTSAGQLYAENLSRFVAQHNEADAPPVILTSTLRRTMQTAASIPHPKTALRALDELNAGICDGLTYAQIAERYPSEYASRAEDKLRYRYPGGESYEDVIQRLESVIWEIERSIRPVLVVAHQAVVRALYAYFMDWSPEVCPHLDAPLHTVLELSPQPYGCEERRYPLGPLPPRAQPLLGGRHR
ncbi:MAG: histidine phosphatase family protein [Myxococcales bacterium]|nr:histidine phosphatase family protein [Myxococcales bacterium]